MRKSFLLVYQACMSDLIGGSFRAFTEFRKTEFEQIPALRVS